MDHTHANVGQCHRCPHFPIGVNGDPPCGVDGVSLMVHAAAGWCPDGRFGGRERPAGLVIPPAGAAVTVRVRVIRPFWTTLHAMIKPTPAEYQSLVDELPAGRRAQWDDVTAARPVRWADFAAWAIEARDDLNEMIGHLRVKT